MAPTTNTTVKDSTKSTPLPWSPTTDFKHVSFEEAVAATNTDPDSEISHAAHCLIYARVEEPLLGLDKDKSHGLYRRAVVMMHLRHDGMIGFPGGKIDELITNLSIIKAQSLVTSAINRELQEEINYNLNPINWSNYIFTHSFRREVTTNIIYAHFFAKELSIDEFELLEKMSLKSEENGREVQGNIRVPLYTMLDGYRGFPAFLDNNFIGSAKTQLELGLVELGIMSREEVERALTAGRRPALL